VSDLKACKAAQSLPIGDDPDVLAYDIKKSTLYVAAESGTVSRFAANHDGLTKIGQGFLEKNAHIVAVDQDTHRVYFPVLADGDPKMLVTVSTAQAKP